MFAQVKSRKGRYLAVLCCLKCFVRCSLHPKNYWRPRAGVSFVNLPPLAEGVQGTLVSPLIGRVERAGQLELRKAAGPMSSQSDKTDPGYYSRILRAVSNPWWEP
jgi:hypothetical protein